MKRETFNNFVIMLQKLGEAAQNKIAQNEAETVYNQWQQKYTQPPVDMNIPMPGPAPGMGGYNMPIRTPGGMNVTPEAKAELLAKLGGDKHGEQYLKAADEVYSTQQRGREKQSDDASRRKDRLAEWKYNEEIAAKKEEALATQRREELEREEKIQSLELALKTMKPKSAEAGQKLVGQAYDSKKQKIEFTEPNPDFVNPYGTGARPMGPLPESSTQQLIDLLEPKAPKGKRIGTQVYESKGKYYVPYENEEGDVEWREATGPEGEMYKTSTRARLKSGTTTTQVDADTAAIRDYLKSVQQTQQPGVTQPPKRFNAVTGRME